MKRELVIGLDIGTTSVKAVLFDRKGKWIAEAERMNTFIYPELDFVEQDPREIECSSRVVLREVLDKANVRRGELLAVGFSSAMHSLICIDDQGEPLSNVLIWSDGRSSKQAEEVKRLTGNRIFLRTGTPIHPMSPLLKLIWMKENRYKPYEQATRYLSIKEYIINKWFGVHYIDYSMASATGLLNIYTRDWDEEALELAGITSQQLSEIVSPTTVLPPIHKEIAKEIGFKDEVPFVIGSCDGQLANLGDGAIFPGEVAISVGTSGAIRQFIHDVEVNESEETFTYLFTEDTAIIGGPTNNGGIVLQWLKDLLEFQGTHEEFVSNVDQVDIGADGILFLPYVNGERAPLWNQQAKGTFYGLSIHHKRQHLVRAVLEGIAFNLYQISESIEKIVGKPKRITINGGMSRSDVWVQIMADLFGSEVELSETHHSAAWGAAWTALVGTNFVASFAEIKENLNIGKIIKPNLDHHQRYLELFSKYKKLSELLSDSYE